MLKASVAAFSQRFFGDERGRQHEKRGEERGEDTAAGADTEVGEAAKAGEAQREERDRNRCSALDQSCAHELLCELVLTARTARSEPGRYLRPFGHVFQ